MNSNIEEMVTGLKSELQLNGQTNNYLKRFNHAIRLVEDANGQLRTFLEEHSLSEPEEIRFFKKIKPLIMSYGIEEGLIYNIFVNRTVGTEKDQLKYFEDELKAVQTTFRRNAFYYQYYRNDFAELDNVFFLRSATSLALPLPEVPMIEGENITPMSCLFARFMAFERLQIHILEQMNALRNGGELQAFRSTGDLSNIKWTGDIINLVELAYGLWLTGQLNNGNVTLTELVAWLEVHFGTNIGIIQKRFAEIERRKRISNTKYLDQMRDAVMARVVNGSA